MNNFIKHMGKDATDSNLKGWLVAILELGAWFGVLCTGYLADKLSRKYTIVTGTRYFVQADCHRIDHKWIAVVVFCIGVIVQTSAMHASSIYGGRFVTGLGVGSLSMAVPLYKCVLYSTREVFSFKFPPQRRARSS